MLGEKKARTELLIRVYISHDSYKRKEIEPQQVQLIAKLIRSDSCNDSR